MKRHSLLFVCLTSVLLAGCGGGSTTPGDSEPPLGTQPPDDTDRTPPYLIAVGDTPGGTRSAPRISDDGSTIIFVAKKNSADARPRDVYVFDVRTSQVRRVIDDGAFYAELSGNGRYIAFESGTARFAEDTNNRFDVYVHDLVTGDLERVSVDPQGFQFTEYSYQPDISADGQRILFANGPYLNFGTLYLHDRSTGTTRLVAENVATDRGYDLSDDGEHVVFADRGSGVDGLGLFLVDLRSGSTTPVGATSGGARFPSISADGRLVAFVSSYSHLVPNDTNRAPDVFVFDTDTAETIAITDTTVTRALTGRTISMSSDGRYIAYSSNDTEAVPGDTNNSYDIFVYERATGQTVRESVTEEGIEGNGSSVDADLSATGRDLVFSSRASNFGNYSTRNNIVFKRRF